ncbi:MAG: iron hydrogenase, partial [Oscillibacter sp.]|nr:iron hydrogenase [Oscillibacter sp.]MCI9300645.1 iron hydrogenase [Oscillibacter sp.]
MRGVHSAVDDIRRTVFKEVAKLAFEGGDPRLLDQIPLKMIQGEVAKHRHDVFLERAIVEERVRLALGLNIRFAGETIPVSEDLLSAEKSQKHFQNPLVNIIPFACNACPPKQLRITDNCQGCISHPCMNVCPKD